MKTKGINFKLPNELNEALLDGVRVKRKLGKKTTKEKIIINIISEHKKEIENGEF